LSGFKDSVFAIFGLSKFKEVSEIGANFWGVGMEKDSGDIPGF